MSVQKAQALGGAGCAAVWYSRNIDAHKTHRVVGQRPESLRGSRASESCRFVGADPGEWVHIGRRRSDAGTHDPRL